MIIWFLFGAMCMLVVLWLWAYFQLSSLNKAARKSWEQLDSKMKHRLELLPGLVLYAASLPELDRAQLQAQQKQILEPTLSFKQRVERESMVTEFFKEIFTAALKQPGADQDVNLIHLKESIIHAENSVQRAKKTYNSSAHKFNLISSLIPMHLVSTVFEMEPYEYFDFDCSIK